MFATSFTATSAPSSANTSAMPRPIPRAAPVISARLPFSFKTTPLGSHLQYTTRAKPRNHETPNPCCFVSSCFRVFVAIACSHRVELFSPSSLCGRRRTRQREHVVALRFGLAREDRDASLGDRFVARRAEDDEFAAAGLEHRRHPFGIRLQLAFPQDLAGVLVERAH